MSPHMTPEIRRFCIDRMREAFDPGTGLFSKQLRNRNWERTEGTEEITSTAICLIALSRAGIDPSAIGVDLAPTTDRVFDHCASRYRGGLGLAAWMNAAWDGEPLGRVLAARGIPCDAAGLGARSITTMETAWMLCGAAHEYARNRDEAAGRLAAELQAELLSRYHDGNRLFRHAAATAPARHRVRKNVANFADQVYSVMALSFDRIARGDARSGEAAAACMDRLTELQGELGQWWWHYDPSAGRVAGHFPVYSVHQHGMAPLALTAVSRFTGRDLSGAIAKSFGWLSRNELGAAMIDGATGTIWRDIEPRRGAIGKAAHDAGMVLGLRESGPEGIGPLEVNYETRPYEWGWCIHFGSLDTKPPRGTHVV
jgi:hypothetical protein